MIARTTAPLAAILLILGCTTLRVRTQMSPAAAPAPYLSSGPTTAAPPGLDCTTKLFNMSDCLSYVQAGSKTAKPEKACCPELAGLVESSPQCLCYLLGGAASQYGVQLDMNRALGLPSVCRVSTPPPSLCAALGVPVAAPSTAMPGAPTPGGASIISPTGSKPAAGATGSASSPTADSASGPMAGGKGDAASHSSPLAAPSFLYALVISAFFLPML